MHRASKRRSHGSAGGEDATPRYSRILLKVSGEMLSGQDGKGLDAGAIDFLTSEIADARLSGTQVAVVTGAGNLCRGAGPNRSALPIARQRMDAMGMLATAINCIALVDGLERKGVRAIHMSTLAAIPHSRPFDSEAADAALSAGFVVVVSGGTGLPFFSTDTGAVVRALQVNADALLKSTQVDGVYDRNPKERGAKLLKTVTYRDVLAKSLSFMDMPAVALAAENGLKMVVFNGHEPGNLQRALNGTLQCTMVEKG